MAEAKIKSEWGHTASILAMINNANPYRIREMKPSEFMPGGDRDKYTMSMDEAARFFNGG